MKTYLHVKSGGLEILLDAEAVGEIVENLYDNAAHGHREWRGMALPVASLGGILGRTVEDNASKMGVVYNCPQAKSGHVFLEVEGISGLKRFEENDFSSLPAIPKQAMGIIADAHLDDESGICLYRCRKELALAVE